VQADSAFNLMRLIAEGQVPHDVPHHCRSVCHSEELLIAEGQGEDEDEDAELRGYAVNCYIDMLTNTQSSQLSDVLIQIVAWVVGEYGYLSELGTDEMCNQLCSLMDETIYEDPSTKCWIVSALLKVTAQSGPVKPNVAAVLNKYKDSSELPLQLRCYEAMSLLQLSPQDIATLLPRDSAMEEVSVDVGLAMLEPFVQAKCAQGAPIYDRAGPSGACRQPPCSHMEQSL
jgi:AP-4 complex subunit epsilon-1